MVHGYTEKRTSYLVLSTSLAGALHVGYVRIHTGFWGTGGDERDRKSRLKSQRDTYRVNLHRVNRV